MDFKMCLNFLGQLQKNNNKDWMDANKPSYQAARQEFIGLATDLIDSVSKFNPDIEGLDPKKAIFRINRDIRFSKDKSPYKNNFGVYIVPGGKKTGNAGYYFHLQPGNESFIAGGMHMPESSKLAKIRQEIDYNASELAKIVNEKAFKSTFGTIEGDKLKRAPKGYAEDHPSIEMLKMKSFLVLHKVEDKAVLKGDFTETIKKDFKTMHGFIDFLNVAVS